MAMKRHVNHMKKLLFFCLAALAGVFGTLPPDDCAWAAGNIPGYKSSQTVKSWNVSQQMDSGSIFDKPFGGGMEIDIRLRI